MARQFNVEGTKSFLGWSIGLLLLGLWCLKDGWYPSPSVLLKHPLNDPTHSNFYLFNKSLSVISLTISAVCAYIHRIVR